MKEIVGELWDYYGKPNTVVCITTNGTVKKSGEAVMGRGCAEEAKARFPKLPAVLGAFIKRFGNRPWWGHTDGFEGLASFPVKHNWWEQADLELIRESAKRLFDWAANHHETFVLPRPGCGNGRLTWEQVRPVIEFLPDNVLVISR